MNDPTTYPQVRNYDAAKFRVSALGVDIADVSNSDAGDFRVSSIGTDASDNRISAIQDNASNLMVSARSDDAALFRISALGVTGVSFDGDAANNRVSSIQQDAANTRISAIQDDASNLNVSAKSDEASDFRVSAFSDDGSDLRVSAVQDDGDNLNVSAKSGDAATLRVSASLYPDTTGGLSVYRTLNISASQAIKATAGAVYGYYLYNYDADPSYVKFYNTSGAINVGTDTPILTIGIPASAAANIEFPHGLVGFTNGIGIAATSGAPDDNTAVPAASAVGGNIFYK